MDNRVGFRNVHIYNGITGEMLGGLRQNGSITEAVFLSMLNDILLIADEPLEVKERDSQRTILPSSNHLEFGIYDVYCNGKCPHSMKQAMTSLINYLDRLYGNEQGTLFPSLPPQSEEGQCCCRSNPFRSL